MRLVRLFLTPPLTPHLESGSFLLLPSSSTHSLAGRQRVALAVTVNFIYITIIKYYVFYRVHINSEDTEALVAKELFPISAESPHFGDSFVWHGARDVSIKLLARPLAIGDNQAKWRS